MALLGLTPKNRFWERISLPVVGSLTPGPYTNPSMTVDEFGRVTTISSNPLTASMNMFDEGGIVGGGPFSRINFAGAGVIATNGGGGQLLVTISGGSAGIGIEKNAVAVPGGPHTILNFQSTIVTLTDQGGGRVLITVSEPATNVKYRMASVALFATTNIGAPLESNATIRRITVSINTAYSPGAAIRIEDGGGNIVMASDKINPQLTGVYEVELANLSTQVGVGNEQFTAVVTGAPVAGVAVVTIWYLLPSA